MTMTELVAMISSIDGAVQIGTNEYVIPTDSGYVGVKATTKRAVATEKLPAFDLDEAVAKWNEKLTAKAEREANKANKPKVDAEAVKAHNEDMKATIEVALENSDGNGMTSSQIIEACNWEGVTTQKVATLCRQLITDQKITKDTDESGHIIYKLM